MRTDKGRSSSRYQQQQISAAAASGRTFTVKVVAAAMGLASKGWAMAHIPFLFPSHQLV